MSFFVLSLNAGGAGLNLTAASHVVHFDPWWNPATENQATLRSGIPRRMLPLEMNCDSGMTCNRMPFRQARSESRRG